MSDSQQTEHTPPATYHQANRQSLAVATETAPKITHLEEFEKESSLLVHRYRISEIDASSLKNLLNIDLAIEQYGCDISTSKLPLVLKYVDEPFSIDKSYDYQIGF